ncbi:MAG: lactate utilization protein B [Chromatocurvus sp.]
MKQTSATFLRNAHDAMQQPERAVNRERLGRLMPKLREDGVASFGDFETLRAHVSDVRTHTLDHLDHYLDSYVAAARSNGNHVHFARDGDELNRLVAQICADHSANKIVKGKSMVTEETALNEHLLAAGLDVTETDLGEYILQQAGETPSHIVGPALHKPEAEIRELFLDRHDLGNRDLGNPAALVGEARQLMRQRFLEADVGIIGANALIAENGYSLLVTNEGNGDLCANLPPVLIVCTTLERLLPRTTDAMDLLRLLARSATGQPISCYSSLYSGPRRDDEQDGPLQTHIVLLDNRRTDILASTYRDMLQCVRCGACLNHCPVYVAAGGHAYGWVYQGPMGSILTPLLTSLPASHDLPNACTACGRCEEVCPANIALPDMLRDLRQEEFTKRLTPRRWRAGMRAHARMISSPGLYHTMTGIAIRSMKWFARGRGTLPRLPLARGWSEARDFPAPESSRTFMQQYARRKARHDRRQER